MNYAKHLNQNVPQSQPLPLRAAEMQLNAAGGYAFTSDDWTRLKRFLMIGTEGGTYYEGERDLTLQNAKAIVRCLKEDGLRTVNEIVAVSERALAPKNDPAIFALAMCFVLGDTMTRLAAEKVFTRVIRTGTHLFMFLENLFTLRGTGRGLGKTARRAVTSWYDKEPRDLAFQTTKYAQRNGWSHRDVLRLTHLKGGDKNSDRNFVLRYALGEKIVTMENAMLFGKFVTPMPALQYLFAVEAAKDATVDDLKMLIREEGIPREVIPTQKLNIKEVWEALLVKMPYTAMLRNLPKMTELGLLVPFSDSLNHVVKTLTDREAIRKAKVHPLALLLAAKTYGSGKSQRGEKSWTPVPAILGALNTAFILSFDTVEPSHQNLVVAIDVSGSMDGPTPGIPGLHNWEAAAAIALVALAANPMTTIICFSDAGTGVQIPKIHVGQSLLEAHRAVQMVQGGGTDLAEPFRWAIHNHLKVDSFLLVTDNESWAGNRHSAQVFQDYRKTYPARWVNLMVTASATQTNDPEDLNSMEMAGFSPTLMTIASEFFNGNL